MICWLTRWSIAGGLASICMSLVFTLPLTGQESRFIDHSLLVAPNFPCTWPSYPFPRFQISRQRTIGPDSIYNIDTLLIDGNTGTQLDVPPHSVARPELNREKSGPFGLAYTDRIEPWQFGGEACVIDVRELLDQAAKGSSPLVTPEHIKAFEKDHRKVGFGDVVLFRSDYSDLYYRPFPEGSRYISDILDGKAPGYPDPNPEAMELLGQRGVLTSGTDSASMGPLPDLAEPTHYAGLKYGMIWTESATRLGELPPTGGFYLMLSPKHAEGPYAECRALSVVGGDLPARLIEACRNKRAIDLSPTLEVDFPLTNPGLGTGQHRQPYLKVNFLYSDYLDMWHHTHLMDAMAGTHLVPPAFALPSGPLQAPYAPEVRGWLQDYERQFGERGFSDRTADKVPLSWTSGPARVINVSPLIGSTSERSWPASPVIEPKHIEAYEKEHGRLLAGDIVIFLTGHVERNLQKAPLDNGMWKDPLLGVSEGWPAPNAATILELKKRGIRCIATDAPDLGGVDARSAAMTYWALGSQDMVGVEFLTNVGAIPADSYFMFAPIKIRDCHGGPGRALVFHD